MEAILTDFFAAGNSSFNGAAGSVVTQPVNKRGAFFAVLKSKTNVETPVNAVLNSDTKNDNGINSDLNFMPLIPFTNNTAIWPVQPQENGQEQQLSASIVNMNPVSVNDIPVDEIVPDMQAGTLKEEKLSIPDTSELLTELDLPLDDGLMIKGSDSQAVIAPREEKVITKLDFTPKLIPPQEPQEAVPAIGEVKEQEFPDTNPELNLVIAPDKGKADEAPVQKVTTAPPVKTAAAVTEAVDTPVLVEEMTVSVKPVPKLEPGQQMPTPAKNSAQPDTTVANPVQETETSDQATAQVRTNNVITIPENEAAKPTVTVTAESANRNREPSTEKTSSNIIQSKDSSAELADDNTRETSLRDSSSVNSTNSSIDNSIFLRLHQLAASKIPVQEAKVNVEESIKHILQRLEIMVSDNLAQAKMVLKPEHLGHLNIRLDVQDGVLTAKFVVESLQAKTMLESNITAFRQQMEQSGVRVEKVEVTLNQPGNDSSQFLNQQQYRQPGQGNYQPMPSYWRDGSNGYQANDFDRPLEEVTPIISRYEAAGGESLNYVV